MALTEEGARLTEIHRLLQVRLSTQAMAATKLLWSQLDPASSVAAQDAWLKQQLQLMKIYDAKGSAAAAQYMADFRVAEGFPGGPIVGVDDFNAEWAEESLSYNSTGKIQALTSAGMSPAAAKQAIASNFLSAAQRVALGGGRRVMDRSSLANPKSVGWRRVSDGDPCSFCAMLVSRGPAYRSARSAGRGRHWHRRCGCSVEETFGDWTPTAEEQRFVDAYDSAAAALDQEHKPHTQANILGHLREHADFNDSRSRRQKQLAIDAKPEKTQLTGSFAPKVEPVKKTQLTGSFAPKVEKTQLTGSFAPKQPEIVKTQLTGSFAPKVVKPEKTQLTGSFAPKAAPKPEAPALKIAPKPKPLDQIKVAAQKPPPKPTPAEPVEPKPTPGKPTPKPRTPPDRERRRFTSDKQGKDWASSVWPGKEGYTAEELRALRSYTGEGYRRTNAALRKSKGARGGSRGLDKAMEHAPRVPEEVVVARGTTVAQFGLTKGSDLSKLTGQSFTEHGYLSTSVDSKGRLANEVSLKLSVPKGHKAVYVSGKNGETRMSTISVQGGGEAELILDRGTRFVVTSAKRVRGQWLVEADVIAA